MLIEVLHNYFKSLYHSHFSIQYCLPNPGQEYLIHVPQ